jgi:hypothetical protein
MLPTEAAKDLHDWLARKQPITGRAPLVPSLVIKAPATSKPSSNGACGRMPVRMFEGFTPETVDLREARLRVRQGGAPSRNAKLGVPA